MNGTSKRIRVKVYCATCHTHLTTVAKPYERKLSCPECQALLRVPAYDPIEAEFLERLREPVNIDPGTYSLSSDETPPTRTSTSPDPVPVAVTCPICRARLHPEIRDEPWFETCPDCLEPVRVPARDELPAAFVPLPIPDPGEYDLGKAGKTNREPPRTDVFDQLSHVKQREQDPPPRWTFFSGVFEFPLSRYVWPRFVWMSIGNIVLWLVAVLCLQFLLGGGFGPLAAAFFALPAIWLFYWTTSYAAAQAMTILENTANGTQVIDEWTDPDWREWMATLIYFAFVALFAQAVSSFVEMLLGPVLMNWWVAGGLLALLFPVVLLSSLEAGSPFIPFTRPVLASLVRFPGYWLGFFFLTGLLTVGLGAIVFYSLRSAPFLSALWGGPLLAAYVLISSRLLGRLAWRVIVEPDGGRKRWRRTQKLRQLAADREIERAARNPAGK